MGDVWAQRVAQVAKGGAIDGRHRIWMTLRLQDGAETSLLMQADMPHVSGRSSVQS